MSRLGEAGEEESSDEETIDEEDDEAQAEGEADAEGSDILYDSRPPIFIHLRYQVQILLLHYSLIFTSEIKSTLVKGGFCNIESCLWQLTA